MTKKTTKKTKKTGKRKTPTGTESKSCTVCKKHGHNRRTCKKSK